MNADKYLAARLARSIGTMQAAYLLDAYRSGQLITRAEADAMVAAERERCAGIIEANMLCGGSDGTEVLHPRTNPGNKTGLTYAAAIAPPSQHQRKGVSDGGL